MDAKGPPEIHKDDTSREDHYKRLFDDAPIGIYRTTLKGRIVDGNPTLVRMLGYPDLESAVAAINKGQVYRYILKPWENDELKLLVKQALDYYDVLRDNRTLTHIARQQAEYLASIRKQFPQIPFPREGLYEVDTDKVSRELAELLKKYSA